MDLATLELQNPTEGSEGDVYHMKGKGKGRLESWHDLVPLAACMKQLVELANPPMPTAGIADGARRAALMHLVVEIRKAVGVVALRDCLQYVVLMQVVPKFYMRGKSGMFRRVRTANELNSIRLIMKMREHLPLTIIEVRKKLANAKENGNF